MKKILSIFLIFSSLSFGETATWSDLVADEVGVNTHFAGAIYAAKSAQVAAEMYALGIRHYRDSTQNPSTHNMIGAYGIKADYQSNSISSGTTCAHITAWIASVNNAEAWDSPNEPDNQGDANWVSQLMTQMPITWNCIQSNYPNIIVYGPAMVTSGSFDQIGVTGGYEYSNTPTVSITTNGTGYSATATMSGSSPFKSVASLNVTQGSGATGTCSASIANASNGYGQVAPLTCTVSGGIISLALQSVGISSYLDYSNVHNYQAGFCPECSWGGNDPQGQAYADFGWNLDRANNYAASPPIVGTESGYVTNITANGANGGIPESVGAAYFPRLILNAVIAGFKYEYIYELADEFALTQGSCDVFCQGSDTNAAQWAYGLLRSDLSPKPSALALMNMIHLLADPGPTYTPGALTYSLSGSTTNVKHLLCQKRNGTFYLALWIGTSDWNVNGTPPATTFPSPQSVTVTITDQNAIAYYQLDHLGGMSLTSESGSSSVTISVNDCPSFLQIT